MNQIEGNKRWMELVHNYITRRTLRTATSDSATASLDLRRLREANVALGRMVLSYLSDAVLGYTEY